MFSWQLFEFSLKCRNWPQDISESASDCGVGNVTVGKISVETRSNVSPDPVSWLIMRFERIDRKNIIDRNPLKETIMNGFYSKKLFVIYVFGFVFAYVFFIVAVFLSTESMKLMISLLYKNSSLNA